MSAQAKQNTARTLAILSNDMSNDMRNTHSQGIEVQRHQLLRLDKEPVQHALAMSHTKGCHKLQYIHQIKRQLTRQYCQLTRNDSTSWRGKQPNNVHQVPQ
jgi:hypothetical protein